MKDVKPDVAQSDVAQQEDELKLDPSDALNSTEVEGDELGLTGYVEDNFEFLDHMDCSGHYQVWAVLSLRGRAELDIQPCTFVPESGTADTEEFFYFLLLLTYLDGHINYFGGGGLHHICILHFASNQISKCEIYTYEDVMMLMD